MKSILLGILLAISAVTYTNAQYDEDALSVLDAMSNKYKVMKGFTSSFTYSIENPSEDLSDSMTGEISIEGNKYRLDLGVQEIINNGETIWTYLQEAQEVNISEYDPEEEELSLTNIFDAYKEGFKYMINPEFTNSSLNVVDLIPEDHDNEIFKIRMFIKTGDATLNKFQIFEKSGNRYVYAIDKFQEKKSFPANTFVFDTAANPNVEVIDFR